MLKTAAVLNFLLAAGHVLCLFRLDAAFRLYRIEPDGTMEDSTKLFRRKP